jgi:hypothetical protein
MSGSSLDRLRRRLGRLFDDDLPPTRASRIFNIALAVLITVNVSGIILESVESIDRSTVWRGALVV